MESRLAWRILKQDKSQAVSSEYKTNMDEDDERHTASETTKVFFEALAAFGALTFRGATLRPIKGKWLAFCHT